jgi:hypothetical protein
MDRLGLFAGVVGLSARVTGAVGWRVEGGYFHLKFNYNSYLSYQCLNGAHLP